MEPLSLTGRHWRLRLQDPMPGHLAGREWTEYLVGRLQTHRAITSDVDDPSRPAGTDARAFRDVQAATDRIQSAIKNNEIIGIFGDYDCDGITSTAIMARYFHRRGKKPLLRLPHRLQEGYGLKLPIMKELIDAGITLLITVDTGVTAVQEIALARQAGMDVIVLDHHHPPATLPSAFAILHPAVDKLPEPHASAAGVVWSLVEYMERQEGKEQWDGRATDLAIAAIGTVADLVELRGDNRRLVQRGLVALQSIEDGPLALLRMQAGLQNAPITSRDLAFRIAPRLNAAGRMAEPSIALQALLGDHQALMRLEELNRDRQTLVQDLMKVVMEQPAQFTAPFLCIKSSSYSPGICGLISGKLTEKFGRPSMVAHEHEGLCTASLRSVPGFHVAEALARCGDLMLSSGGHAMAAGCAFRAEHFDAIAAMLTADVERTMPIEMLVPSLEVDMAVGWQHLNQDLCEALRTLEPHGQGNPEPSFLLKNIVIRNPRRVGRDSTHLQGFIGPHKIVGFQLGALAENSSTPLDAVCRLGIDTWQGNRSLQLFIEDLRTAVKTPEPAFQH